MKHERAILVGLAYLIGFNAAFIAFGIPQVIDTPRVITANAVSDQIVPADINVDEVVVENRAAGLYAVVGNDERVLSVKTEMNSDGAPGAHVDTFAVAVSPDGRFIHFCEQAQAGDGFCHHYVYVVDTHEVAPVKVSEALLSSDIGNLQAQWGEDGRLFIEKASSINPEVPWRLDWF